MNTSSISKNQTRLAYIILGVMFLSVNLIRINLTKPASFYEGDDAAISAGIARLCAQHDIGPYFFHPQAFSNVDYDNYLKSEGNPENNPLLRKFYYPSHPPFYRYNTLPGMYFLGSLLCAMGPPALIFSGIIFVLGALLPILIAVWMQNLFKPLSLFALPLCYLSIAVSPEIWISGSVYINDKIFSITFLTASLLLITNFKPLNTAKELFLTVLSGTAFALSVLFRFDSILFLAGVIMFLFSPIFLDKIHRKLYYQSIRFFVFIASASLLYVMVILYMDGSFLGAVQAGTGEKFDMGSISMIRNISAAGYGMGTITLATFFIILLLAVETTRLIKTRQLILKINPTHYVSLILILLVTPEIWFFVNFPYSPKYLLFSSCLLAGLVIILPIKYLQSNRARFSDNYSLKIIELMAWMAPIIVVLSFSGIVKVKEIPTNDGMRYFGAHLRTPVSKHPDSEKASQIFNFIDSNEDWFTADIFIKKPSWVLEESIAYQAAIRGWKNELIPTTATRPGSNEEISWYIALNQYSNSSNKIRIFVPSDYEALVFGDRFTDETFLNLAIAPAIFFEGNETFFSNPIK